MHCVTTILRFARWACIVCAVAVPMATGADQRKDAMLAKTMQDGEATAGDIIPLQAGDTTVNAVFLATEVEPRRGGIVLLHDLHGSADAPGVMRQLRLGLADAGWDTLAPMLPTGFQDDTVAAWAARHPLVPTVEAAINWLGARDIDDIALIGLGGGGNVTLQALAVNNPRETAAIALVGSVSNAEEHRIIAELALPTLDVYAEFDFYDVKQAVAVRKEALADSTAFTQREVTGARPGFLGLEQATVATVRAWLNGVIKPSTP